MRRNGWSSRCRCCSASSPPSARRLGKAGPVSLVEYRLVPLISCAVQIGEDLSAASLTRGLGAPVRRTNICDIGFGAADVVVWAACAVSVGLLVASSLGWIGA